MNPNKRLLALCALGYSDDIDPDERRAWRRFLRRNGVNPAQTLRDYHIPVRLRRVPALDRSGIPYDLNLLGGGEGGADGLGFGSPDGFYKNIHFFPKDVARLAYALQLDRPGEDLIVRDLEVDQGVVLAAVCHRTMRVGCRSPAPALGHEFPFIKWSIGLGELLMYLTEGSGHPECEEGRGLEGRSFSEDVAFNQIDQLTSPSKTQLGQDLL